MGELLPLVLKYWKPLAVAVSGAALGAYIAFQHQVIANDHVMLGAAHDQMIKMSAEYRADVETMTKTITAQNTQIDQLNTKSVVAKDALAAAEAAANKVHRTTNAQVNAILAKPTPVGCENSINSAITNIQDLKWEHTK